MSPPSTRLATLAAATGTAMLAAWTSPVQASIPLGDVPDPRPNIILISSDDQRASDLWVMDKVQTRLASHGTTFARAYAPYPLCCPARASILTGQYAHNHGVLGNQSRTAPLGGYAALDGNSTLATWLADAGYQTAFVGKYLNGYGSSRPLTVPPGWTEWHGSVAGGNYFKTRLFEDGVSNLYDGPYQTDLYGDIATDIIARRVPDDAPLFLYASYYAPHVGLPVEEDDPINVYNRKINTPAVAPRHRDVFADVPLPRDPSFNEADVSDKPTDVKKRGKLSSTMQGILTEYNQQRLESLLSLDQAVAKMIRALYAAGELDNTIVVFTSDNGYMLGEHRIHAGKTVPYEPSARIPMIIRGPGFPAGVERDQPAALIDLAPTFVEAAQATPGLELDGTSLLPLAADPTVGLDRDLVMEAGPRTLDGPWFYRGVRSEQWLYLEYDETGEVELYNMANDPYQLDSLHADPAYAGERARLAALLATLRDCAGASCRDVAP